MIFYIFYKMKMKFLMIAFKRILSALVIINIASLKAATLPIIPSETFNATATQNLNIAPFGLLKSWNNLEDPLGQKISYNDFNQNAKKDSSDIGFIWWQARDIQRIKVIYNDKINQKTHGLPIVQYWHQSWPETPPEMPTKNDLEDDLWQGEWITAETYIVSEDKSQIFTFKPMKSNENPDAGYLPGDITYRRTLKVRLVYPFHHPSINTIHVYSVSMVKESSIRIEFIEDNRNESYLNVSIDVFNGQLQRFSPWNWNNRDKRTSAESFILYLNSKLKGIIAHINASTESLPGSNDETVITLRTTRGTFSVSLADIEKGPVYIPHYKTYITLATDVAPFSVADVITGKTTLKRIQDEAEQTFDRARQEIPSLDPTNRAGGGYIDLPLAPDASWQKFSVQWGGNVLIDKSKAKVRGSELLRCNWIGDNLTWEIGTGKEPVFKRTRQGCMMSIMNNYLPVVEVEWNHEGLIYREEAFATLLHGPLSPSDSKRNEQTPAILMIKLTISNPSNHSDTSHFWLSGNRALTDLSKDGDFLMDQIKGEKYIRCFMPPITGVDEKIDIAYDTIGTQWKIHRQTVIKGNSSQSLLLYFPFVGDMTKDSCQEIASLNFEIQKNRIASYWRDIVTKTSFFNVPEQKFNEMAKAVIPHIRMSVTKDPKRGLYLVPAATFQYKVYPNESIFQTLLLDRIGDFSTSSDYLNTFIELQGSARLPGTFTGDQIDVYYGTRIDKEYNMTESNGYNMHHGTVLWGLAKHYLYSTDREWLFKAAPSMIRAANWIIEQRSHTKLQDENGNKVIHYGLLPSGVLEDVHDWQFWYATNAYALMGIESMALAFKKAGLPEAEFYRKEAEEYHNDIRQSMERASELCPVVKLRNNTYVPYIPSHPYQRFRYFGPKKAEFYDRYNLKVYPNLRLSATREVLYGPVVLLKAGLIEANEPMAEWILEDWENNITLSSSLNLNAHGVVDDEFWFSRGGMVFQANLQNPVGIYLIRQEIQAAIRGLYNNFVACLYPDINALAEEFREWGHGSGPFYKCPDEARFISQIYDLLVLEKKDELWLAVGTPRRWLEPGQTIELNKAKTSYGEVSYRLKYGKETETIEADIKMAVADCAKILLFVRSPFQKPILSVMLNGQEWKDWDRESESITIPQLSKDIHISVLY